MAILGQDAPSIVTRFFDFLPCFLSHPVGIRFRVFDDYYKRYDVHWYRFIYTDSRKPIGRHPRCSYTLHCPDSYNQFVQLCSDRPVVPDPYSGRFGLRANQLTAVQRAHEFMNWRQDGRDPGNDGHVHQKKLVVCTLKITSLWYFALIEQGTLEKGDGSNHRRAGYFRWNGPLFKETTVIHKGTNEVFFRIMDEFMEIV